jgi:hypothetical protein
MLNVELYTHSNSFITYEEKNSSKHRVIINNLTAPDRQIVKTTEMYTTTVCWDVAPCSLVKVYRRFRGSCCLCRLRFSVSCLEHKSNL